MTHVEWTEKFLVRNLSTTVVESLTSACRRVDVIRFILTRLRSQKAKLLECSEVMLIKSEYLVCMCKNNYYKTFALVRSIRTQHCFQTTCPLFILFNAPQTNRYVPCKRSTTVNEQQAHWYICLRSVSANWINGIQSFNC